MFSTAVPLGPAGADKMEIGFVANGAMYKCFRLNCFKWIIGEVNC